MKMRNVVRPGDIFVLGHSRQIGRVVSRRDRSATLVLLSSC